MTYAKAYVKRIDKAYLLEKAKLFKNPKFLFFFFIDEAVILTAGYLGLF